VATAPLAPRSGPVAADSRYDSAHLKTNIDELLQSYAREADSRRLARQTFAETARRVDGDACIISQIDEESLVLELRVACQGREDPLHAISYDEEQSLIALRPLGRVDRWAMRTGLSRRSGLGDPDFDALVYVDADVPGAWVRSMLASTQARAAVVALVTAGLEVRINDRNAPVVSAVRMSSVKKKVPDAAAVRSWLASLSTVAQAVSAMPLAGPEGGGLRARMPYPFILLAVSVVTVVASFFGRSGPHSASDPACDSGICLSCDNAVVGAAGNLCFLQSPPAKWGLLSGVVVAIAIVLIYGRRLRGTSNAHVVLLQSPFFPVLFFVISGMGIGSTIDALLFGR